MTAPLGSDPTDWTGYDVPTIAAMLTEDHSRAWDQVTAWRTSYALITDERVRITTARAELEAAWPPAHSTASAVFFEAVDGLVRSMGETAEAALTNSNALSGVLAALAEAKTKVDTLHSTWRARASSSTPQENYPATAADPTAWQRDLNAQAHQIMTTTDQTIFENARRLVHVAPIYALTYDTFTPIRTGQAEQNVITSMSAAGHQSFKIGIQANRFSNYLKDKPSITPVDEIDSPQTEFNISSASQLTNKLMPGQISETRGSLITSGESEMLSASHNAAKAPSPSIVEAGSKSDGSGHIGSSPKSTTSEGGSESAKPLDPIFPPLSSPTRAPGWAKKQRTGERQKWKLSKGVRSVIQPTMTATEIHDPGSGIIGVDR